MLLFPKRFRPVPAAAGGGSKQRGITKNTGRAPDGHDLYFLPEFLWSFCKKTPGHPDGCPGRSAPDRKSQGRPEQGVKGRKRLQLCMGRLGTGRDR